MTNLASTDATFSSSASSRESCASGANWGAIFAGGVGATAISIMLLTLGSALGFSAIAPWSSSTAASFTMKAAMWLIFTQWIASGLGGYIAGRLRTKWVDIHTDEVFFRDTAHGFLTWALATILTAAIMVMGMSSLIGGGAKSASALAAGAAAGSGRTEANRPGGMMDDPFAYSIDTLYRPKAPNAAAPVMQGEPASGTGSATGSAMPAPAYGAPPPHAPDSHGEVTRIFLQGLKNGSISEADKAYLAQVIAAQTGISQQEASARVDDTMAKLNAVKEQAKQNAEEARKAAMHVSLYMAFAMLIGAFIASVAATLGGRLRDEYHAEFHSGRRL